MSVSLNISWKKVYTTTTSILAPRSLRRSPSLVRIRSSRSEPLSFTAYSTKTRSHPFSKNSLSARARPHRLPVAPMAAFTVVIRVSGSRLTSQPLTKVGQLLGVLAVVIEPPAKPIFKRPAEMALLILDKFPLILIVCIRISFPHGSRKGSKTARSVSGILFIFDRSGRAHQRNALGRSPLECPFDIGTLPFLLCPSW